MNEKMILDTSLFISNWKSDEKQKNYKKIKNILFCSFCKTFPKILFLKLIKNEIVINCKCNCNTTTISLDEFFKKYIKEIISYKKEKKEKLQIITTNSLQQQECYEFNSNPVPISNNLMCKCKTKKEFYCHDCNIYICKSCMNEKHREHQYIIYSPKCFLTRKDFLLYLQKKNYEISAIKNSTKKYFEIFHNIRRIKSDLIKYYNFNTSINDKLTILFSLIINNFKLTQSFQFEVNYKNLVLFQTINSPFSPNDILGGKKIWRNFIWYCKTQFLIKIELPLSQRGYLHQKIQLDDFGSFNELLPLSETDFAILCNHKIFVYTKQYLKHGKFEYKESSIPKLDSFSPNGITKLGNEIIVKFRTGFAHFKSRYKLDEYTFYPLVIEYSRNIATLPDKKIAISGEDEIIIVDIDKKIRIDSRFKSIETQRVYALSNGIIASVERYGDLLSFYQINPLKLLLSINTNPGVYMNYYLDHLKKTLGAFHTYGFGEASQFIEIPNKNLLIINCSFTILFWNTKTFQVQTVYVKKDDIKMNIHLISNELILIPHKNAIKMIDLISLQECHRFYIKDFRNIHGLNEKFVFVEFKDRLILFNFN